MRAFVILLHAFEKHLDASNLSASRYLNRFIMSQSIKNCLNQPDEISQHVKRFELVKRFPYNIGVMGYTNQSSQSVKVVNTRTRKMVFVITAYPILSRNKTCMNIL